MSFCDTNKDLETEYRDWEQQFNNQEVEYIIIGKKYIYFNYVILLVKISLSFADDTFYTLSFSFMSHAAEYQCDQFSSPWLNTGPQMEEHSACHFPVLLYGDISG